MAKVQTDWKEGILLRLSRKDRARLRGLITAYSGLDESVQTDQALERAIAQRLAAHQMAGMADYWLLIQKPPSGNGEMSSLVQLLTNNETFFFRETHQFEVLHQHILPELLQTRRQPLRLWSAGCATGEEPYSLAIMLLEYQARRGKFPVEVIATDIDAAAIERAKRGYFGDRAVRLVPEKLRQRYFSFDGRSYRIGPEVAQLVRFRELNLVAKHYPTELSNLDIIFCRNITIYFSEPAREQLNARLAGCLRDGGYLFVASAETMSHDQGRLELVAIDNTFLFRKGPPSVQPSPAAVQIPKVEGRARRPAAADISMAVQAPEGVRPPNRGRLGARVAAPVPQEPEPDVVMPIQLSLFGRALDAFRHQDYWEALRELDRLPADEPVEPEVYCLRATILLQQERLDEAEVACQYLLALDPWHADAHFLMGMISRQRGEVDVTVRSLRTAIYLQPDHRDAHFFLAEVYRGSGFVDQARREYQNTLNILSRVPDKSPTISWTGLADEMVRGACEVNLRKLGVRV